MMHSHKLIRHSPIFVFRSPGSLFASLFNTVCNKIKATPMKIQTTVKPVTLTAMDIREVEHLVGLQQSKTHRVKGIVQIILVYVISFQL